MHRRSRLELAVMLAIAAGLIAWGYWRVYPHQVNGDEWMTIARPLWMLFNDPIVQNFRKGGNLHLHLLSASYIPLVAYWHLTGQLPAVLEVTGTFASYVDFGSPLASQVYHQAALTARTVSVVAAILAVYVTYLLGRELAGHRAGIVAGLATAVNPLFVTVTKFAGEDAVQILLVVMTLLLLVRAVGERADRTLMLAAIALGLAVSAKATSGLLLPAFALALYHVEWERQRSVAHLLQSTSLYALLASLAYFVTTPAALFWPADWAISVASYTGLSLIPSIPVTGGLTYQDPGWVVFLGHLAISMGFYLFVLAVGATTAVAWKAYRRDYDRRLFILLAFTAAYSAVMLSPRMPQPFRMPLLHPVLGVFVGVVLVDLFGRRTRLATAAGYVGLAVILLTAASTGYAVSDAYTTRAEATQWTHANVEPGATVDVYSYRVYRPEFPAHANVTRYRLADPTDPASRELALRRIKQRCPDYVGLTSYYYARFFTASNSFEQSTELMDILLNHHGGYEYAARFGRPVIERDLTPERSTPGLVHRFVRSLDYLDTTLVGDGNPTVVILERSSPPRGSCSG